MKARKAGPSDASALVEAAALMAAESDYNDVPFDYSTAKATMDAACEQRDGLAAFVVEGPKGISGGAVFHCGPTFFSKAQVVSDLGIYILPEYRRMGAGQLLLEAVESWAAEQGASRIYLGSTADINTDRVRRVYEDAGYSTVGYNFRKAVYVHGPEGP